MNLGKIFNFLNKEENDSNDVKQEIDYEKLIKEMKLAKKMNDTIRQEIFEKAEAFEKSMKK